MLSEEELLEVHQAFDRGCNNKDLATLASLLDDEKATFRGDGVLMPVMAHGKEAVCEALGHYFDKCNPKDHQLLMQAADAGSQVAFGFWVDRTAAAGQDTAGGAGSVLGFWKLAMDARGRVKEVWCLRQATSSELETQSLPQVERVSYNPQAAFQPKVQLSEEQLQKLRQAARQYNEIWKLRKAELAWEVLEPGFLSTDFITGMKMEGPATVVEVVQQMPRNWELEKGELDLAYVAGTNKAFGHWSHTGRMDGGELSTVWGLGFMAFNADTLRWEHDLSGMNCWKSMTSPAPEG